MKCTNTNSEGYAGRDQNPARSEPPIDEILSDSIIRLVMKRDRLDPGEVQRFMEASVISMAKPKVTPRPPVPRAT